MDVTVYDAKLRIDGDQEGPLPVTVDLTGDRLKMLIGDEEVADWGRGEMRISALPDGFHIRAEGESVVLDVTDDAHFALELGLHTAHPRLRQRMSALIRSDED
ncbi:MAG: hypothetical protein DWQ20_03550 [Actinobacteria bacterium]|nr:MAG: hypothetical protein DWQ20_03550 [Actinomycetota bacterium]